MVMIMMIKVIKYLVIIILILGVMNMFCLKKNKYKYEAGKKYYFKDAELKFNPQPFNIAEYKDFEDETCHCHIGIFNEKNDLVVYEKWFLFIEDVKEVRIEKYISKDIIKGLIDNLYPALYYSIRKENGVERPDKQIDIKIAEELSEYYRLTFDTENLRIRHQKITKERYFVETNTYDKEGKMIMSVDCNDEYCIKYVFDEKGKLIEEVKEKPLTRPF